ncbi:MAG: folate family ECF transporter S component [Lachnospiraceae bacterium]|nr:folate family ECF transporter S component [Lachnospiraceae bacterium]
MKNKSLKADPIKAKSIKSKITLGKLCQIAMLIALTFVLERYVPALNLLTTRISFAFIPMMFCGMMFGSVCGAAAFGISDILGWPIMGLQPIPLILFSRIVNGFIFGFVLHRGDIKFWPHAVVSALASQVICTGLLTTLGLSIAYGTSFFALLLSRLPQFFILLVLQLAVYPILLKLRTALLRAGYA